MDELKMYQVSTLQALALGYTRAVIDVEELEKHGDTGLGTFTGVDGEMIFLDGKCYRAKEDGSVVEAEKKMGVPFASICYLKGSRTFELSQVKGIDELKNILNNKIEEKFGLNSMHMVRIDGGFPVVHARSESAYHAIHVSLKDMLAETQKSFCFEQVHGSLVCVYYPDYMDGINAAGWHFHFVSDDRTKGGHVFKIEMSSGKVQLDKINLIELQLPTEPMFDTYALKGASEDEIKQVEQGK
ncbi:MAG: acetolactate decarboxylase [Eubacterium sp.]|nr:acetolactate decarboxylase [Eubacterium sp.]